MIPALRSMQHASTRSVRWGAALGALLGLGACQGTGAGASRLDMVLGSDAYQDSKPRTQESTKAKRDPLRLSDVPIGLQLDDVPGRPAPLLE